MNSQDPQFKSLKLAFGVLSTLFLVVLIVWFGVGISNKIKEGKYIGRDVMISNMITVSASGEVYAKPDLALVDFSVITEKKQVSEAIADNTKKTNAVIEAIKKEGVEEKDLKTTIFTINPRYEWHKDEFLKEKRVLVGYEVKQTLEVKIRDLTKIGEIIQIATDVGANQVGELQFTIDNQDELKSQARKEAIEKAEIKAKEIAKELGVKLARIINFSEEGIVPDYSPYFMDKMSTEMSGEAPQIQTGENKIEVNVSIIYEIE